MLKWNRKLLPVILLTLILLGACSIKQEPATTSSLVPADPPAPSTAQIDGTSTPSETTTEGILPPVETVDPNTDFKPAWAGQTRAPGIVTETPYTASVFAKGLDSPWGIASLPDGRFAVTQKAGQMVIIGTDGSISEPVTGFPEVESSGQGGLLDVLPAEDFDVSRTLYFTLSERTSEGSLTAAGKGRLADDETTIEEFTILFRAIPVTSGRNHYGSRLDFDHEGHLLMTTGDRQSQETRMMAQELDNGLGKILRITTDGMPVSDNPFTENAGALSEIYSYGHRNVQGLAVHPETHEIWISEMGPQGGDELNLIESGKNYGWPIISYGEEYSGSPILDGIAVMDGMEQPRYYWDPVVAPSGMVFYDHDRIPEWQNNLFITSLRGQHILRLILDGHDAVGEERLLTEEGERFRDITVSSDGALYAITDSGLVYRVGS